MEAIRAWKMTNSGWAMRIGTKAQIASPVTSPTSRPRVTPPMTKPKTSSSGAIGGIRMSTMLPWTFAITTEEEVLAKAFWAIAIMIRPGARNSR
ncbi:hypothetical protein D3C71_1933450 [compost metagenome]